MNGGQAEDLGPILYRLDMLEREAELAPFLAAAYAVPAGEGRQTVVAHDWGESDRRRAICSAATGPYVDLLTVTTKTLADYARRQRWDLVVEYEVKRPLPPAWLKFALMRELLDHYGVVVWLDADAVFADPGADLGAALDPAADVCVSEPIAASHRPPAIDSGLIALRDGQPSRQLLDELLARPEGDPDVALWALLEQPSSPHRVHWLDRTWDSIPSGARAPRPSVLHFAATPLEHRHRGLLTTVADAHFSSATGGNPLDEVRRRKDLPRLLNRLGLLGTGVEVGVRSGDFSASILHRWQGYRLISVDPWSAALEDEYVDIANVEQDRHDELLEQTRHRLGPFGSRSDIWRMTSAKGAARQPDAELDFIYLDARHDEASVSEDLELWYPKLSPGGIIAGHDYLDGDLPQGRFGVKTAVDRFFSKRDLPVRATSEDAPWLSWFVLAPA